MVTDGPDGSQRRDRHGRGLRGPLLPQRTTVSGDELRVPAAQTRAERFDDLVLDIVDELDERWAEQLHTVEFAVEDVPQVTGDDSGVVADETAGGDVPLGRVVPAATGADGRRTPARLVVYRRPLEVRAADRADLAELTHDVVVDLVARLLGVDPDEVDRPRHGD